MPGPHSHSMVSHLGRTQCAPYQLSQVDSQHTQAIFPSSQPDLPSTPQMVTLHCQVYLYIPVARVYSILGTLGVAGKGRLSSRRGWLRLSCTGWLGGAWALLLVCGLVHLWLIGRHLCLVLAGIPCWCRRLGLACIMHLKRPDPTFGKIALCEAEGQTSRLLNAYLVGGSESLNVGSLAFALQVIYIPGCSLSLRHGWQLCAHIAMGSISSRGIQSLLAQ